MMHIDKAVSIPSGTTRRQREERYRRTNVLADGIGNLKQVPAGGRVCKNLLQQGGKTIGTRVLIWIKVVLPRVGRSCPELTPFGNNATEM
jgi:hypothetical protein